jgi:type IV pilus assembly protein PilW
MKLLNNYNISTTSKSQQSGFSLIELLIASTLGLFVIGGVITSFVGTKDSEQMRSAVSEMDANARTAIEVLRKNISVAGYPSKRVLNGFDKPFYSEKDEDNDSTKGSINRSCGGGVARIHTDVSSIPSRGQYTADSNDRTGRGDVLTAVVLADNPCIAGVSNCSASLANIDPKAMVYTDCAGGGSDRDAQAVSCSTDRDVGMPNAKQAKLYSTFFLGSGNDEKKRTLYCRGNRGGTVPVAENVEYLQFLYGVVRTDGTTEYMKADDVEAGTDLWRAVKSVRVGLLVRSSQKNLLKKASKKDHYLLLDRNVEVKEMRRLYRVYTTTINLPNRSI